MGVECDGCKASIFPGDEIVTFENYVLCSLDCLVMVYLQREHIWKSADHDAEYVEQNYERGTL